MNKILEQIEKKKLAPKPLLIEAPKEFKEEAHKIKQQVFDKFGINNKTARFVKHKFVQRENLVYEARKEVATNEFNKTLSAIFTPYKIIEYRDFDQVCKDHKLVMSGLHRYNEVIPEENLHELEAFVEMIEKKRDCYMGRHDLNKMKGFKNHHFMFSFISDSLTTIDYNNLFFIAAPQSHFNFNAKDVKIGNEVQHLGNAPRFTYKFGITKPPKPIIDLDPVIFMPFRFNNLKQIFIAIITAWNEVADDLRIRNLF